MDEIGRLFDAWTQSRKNGDREAAEAARAQIVRWTAEHKDQESNVWAQAMQVARRCEAAPDWEGAEEAYRLAIEMSSQPLERSNTFCFLASLYGLLDRKEEALAAARSAVAQARDGSIRSVLWFALRAEADWCLQMGDFFTASKVIDEALQVIADGALSDRSRFRALVLRARCALGSQNLPGAAADLSAARTILEPEGAPRTDGGPQEDHARWWAATARERAARDDLEGSAKAWGEATAAWRVFAQAARTVYGWNSLAIMLGEQGRALEAAGEHPAAAEALEESRSLRRSLGLPPID